MIPRYSQACIDLVKQSEGLRLNCYDDAVGKKTVGWGHLCAEDDPELLTTAEAEDLLLADLDKAWHGVKRLVEVDLTQGQVDGLTDFVFNLGATNLAKSTLLKLVNQGRPLEAADQFQRWVWAGAVKLPGLVTRRERERQLFLAADD